MKKILLFSFFFIFSIVGFFYLAPNSSSKAFAIACGTRNAAGCEQSGDCQPGFTCTSVGTCNYSCLADVNCTSNGGFCTNAACQPPNVPGNGSCSGGLTCCKTGSASSCTSADCIPACDSSLGQTCTGTKPSCSCSSPPPGGGGPPPPPPAQYPVGDGRSCYGEGARCWTGGVDLSGRTCCPSTPCVPIPWVSLDGRWAGVCKTPAIAAGDTNCNGSLCRTAIGDIPTTPEGFVKTLFAVLLGISGGVAVILIIISGYKLMTSRGNPEAVQGAKEQLTAAIVGLLFIIFSLAILDFIGVSLLRLPGFNP